MENYGFVGPIVNRQQRHLAYNNWGSACARAPFHHAGFIEDIWTVLKAKIMVVEDDVHASTFIADVLVMEGYKGSL